MVSLSNTQFEGKEVDDVLLSHYNHLTRYEHSFEHLPKGDCGKLFEIAVEQYNLNMKSKFTLPLAEKMLENSSFDENECQHVSAGYTWVLLSIKEDESTCEVHIPLDLRNYDKEDRITHPIFRLDYAEKAILEKNSWCYYVDESNQKREVTYIALDQNPVFNHEEPVYHYEYHTTHVVSDEDEDLKKRRNFNYKSDNIDDAIHRDIPDETEDEDNDHEIHEEGIKVALDECTHEDKLKVLYLYAANIVGNHDIGFQIYTENVINCRAGHDEIDTYAAEIILDDKLCDFHVVHDAKNVQLNFMPTRSDNIVSCKDFKGLHKSE